MTDHWKARPVSGEILSDAAGSGRKPADDVVDAEYVTVAAEQGQAPRAAVQPGAAPQPAAGMDILRGDASGAAVAAPRNGGPMFWLLGLVTVFAAFWVSGGHALVSRASPQGIAQTVARSGGLRIVDVASRTEKRGERAHILVDGSVTNDAGSALSLRGLDIVVIDNAGRTTRYALGTGGRSIAPGERFAFSSRLDAPREGAKSVTVDFSKEGAD